MLICHYFYKAQMIIWYYFHKTQMLIWHLFYKAQIYFGNYFTKPKMIFWQKQLLYTQNPNAILAHIYKMQVLFWHLFLHIPNPTLMVNINIHPLRNTSFTRFIKAYEYHPWQNYSFCRNNQAQRKLNYKAQPTHRIQQLKAYVKWPAKSQHKQLEPFPSSPNLSKSNQKGTHVP